MVIILYLWYIQNDAPKLLLVAQPLKHPQSVSELTRTYWTSIPGLHDVTCGWRGHSGGGGVLFPRRTPAGGVVTRVMEACVSTTYTCGWSGHSGDGGVCFHDVHLRVVLSLGWWRSVFPRRTPAGGVVTRVMEASVSTTYTCGSVIV